MLLIIIVTSLFILFATAVFVPTKLLAVNNSNGNRPLVIRLTASRPTSRQPTDADEIPAPEPQEIAICNDASVNVICELTKEGENFPLTNITTGIWRLLENDETVLIEQTANKNRTSHILTHNSISMFAHSQSKFYNDYVCKTGFYFKRISEDKIELTSEIIRLRTYNCTLTDEKRVYKKRPGKRVEFFCPSTFSSENREQPMVEWFFDGTHLKNETKNVLILADINSTDSGIYHCFESNSSSLTAFELRVMQKPDEVENFSVGNITNSSAILSWKPRMLRRPNRWGIVTERFESYKIDCFSLMITTTSAMQNYTKTFNHTENNGTGKVVFENLRPSTFYVCRMQARNEFGESNRKRIMFFTGPRKNEPITAARIGQRIRLECSTKNLHSSTILDEMEWELLRFDENDTIIHDRPLGWYENATFTINAYMPSDAGDYYCFATVKLGDDDRFRFQESFKIVTRADDDDDSLSAIKNLRCANYTNTSITIAWEKRQPEVNVKSYKIIYWLLVHHSSSNDYDEQWQQYHSKETLIDATSIEISEFLQPENMYQILVMPIFSPEDDDYNKPAKVRCLTGTNWDAK